MTSATLNRMQMLVPTLLGLFSITLTTMTTTTTMTANAWSLLSSSPKSAFTGDVPVPCCHRVCPLVWSCATITIILPMTSENQVAVLLPMLGLSWHSQKRGSFLCWIAPKVERITIGVLAKKFPMCAKRQTNWPWLWPMCSVVPRKDENWGKRMGKRNWHEKKQLVNWQKTSTRMWAKHPRQAASWLWKL